jgi:phage shock protein A
MQARAGALDELMASGALDDVTGPPRDDIQAELDRMRGGHDVDLELERLKGEIAGAEARQIEGGAGAGGASTQAAPAEQPQAGEGS